MSTIILRGTLHQRLRARGHRNLKALIGGIPLHYTLELEGIRKQASFNGWKHLHELLHSMQWLMYYGQWAFA